MIFPDPLEWVDEVTPTRNRDGEIFAALHQCPYCKSDLYLSALREPLLRCKSIKCDYEVTLEHAQREILVWVTGEKSTHSEVIQIIKLRADGYTADGRRWAYFTL